MATATVITNEQSSKDESQLVTFQLGEEEFGFDIMSVQEIIRVPKMARVPKAPGYVDGVANLRGVVLPIVDTRTRFGMARSEETDRTRVLVIDIDGVKTGLRVDRVRQVTRISHNDMELPPHALRGVSGNFLKSICKLENGKRIIMALNPAQVCEVGVEKLTAESAGALGGTESDAVETTAINDDVEQMVTFRLAKEEFAFRIDRVREILRVESPKEVPDTPDYVLGILTVRGKILPIIDLRRLLSQCPLAEEMSARCQGISDRLIAWTDQARRQITSGAKLTDLSGPESLRTWLGEFNPASGVLMAQAAKLRAANDQIIKSAKEMDASIDRIKAFDVEIAPSMTEIKATLDNLGGLFVEHICEDQRVIVVESRGVLLGLVVDHVNEVLNIPKGLIDPAPKLTSAGGMQMAGIAKLQDGKRLIMALDTDHLLKDENLQEVQKLDTSAAAVNISEASQKGQEMAEEQLVTFVLDKEEFGIPISQIQEIDRVSQITRVPKSPSFVEGVTNLRGEVIPVINTRKRFGMEVKAVDDRTRVIIVDLNGAKTGLLVDSVRENLNLPKKDIAPPPHAIQSGVDSRFISGIGKVDNGKRMIVLLNVEQILS
jgi:chemotaxis signal transduction protein